MGLWGRLPRQACPDTPAPLLSSHHVAHPLLRCSSAWALVPGREGVRPRPHLFLGCGAGGLTSVRSSCLSPINTGMRRGHGPVPVMTMPMPPSLPPHPRALACARARA